MAPLDTPLRFGSLSLADVLQRAAEKYGLEVGTIASSGFATTKPLYTFGLRGVLLDHIKASGFELDMREDGITTLRLANADYPVVPGYCHSNYWNFRTNKQREGERVDRLELGLHLKLGASERLRGVVCRPFVAGTFLSAGDQVPHNILTKVLVQWRVRKDLDVHPLVSVAAQMGEAVVQFADIGLGGLRTTARLFTEFTAERRMVEQLARSSLSPFAPAPYTHADTVWFVPEPGQAALMDEWRRQLAEFRSSLA
jgi:hypothetical protein